MQNLTEESLDSQNYNLRVSDSFVVEETQESSEYKYNIYARGVPRKDVSESEVIVISDSSEEESPVRKEWNKLDEEALRRTTGENSPFAISSIGFIQSPGSDVNVRASRGTYRSNNNKKSPTKTSKTYYTSDETLSDVERKTGDKENLKNGRENDSIIPETDDSMWSFDRMKGVLTDNECNVNLQESPKSLKKKNAIVKSRTNSANKKPGSDKTDNKNIQEKRRINEWQRISESDKNKKYDKESLNNLKENVKKFVERKTPEIFGVSKNELGGLNILKDSNKRLEIPKTPELAQLTKKQAEFTRSGEKVRDKQEVMRTPTSAKTVKNNPKLSKKDFRTILKKLESQKAVYQSPKVIPDTEESSDSEEDERRSTPKPHPAVIEETDSESEENVIQGSKVDLLKPFKTHVTRFLEPTVHSPSLGMSESKKLEIANWLMTNSVERASGSSVSNVSPSNRNSSSSGNSSLERLEMNYETPNNRDKMRNNRQGEKRTDPQSPSRFEINYETPNNRDKMRNNRQGEKRTDPRTTGSAKSVKSNKSTNLRQATIDQFVKNNDNGKKILTPVTPVQTKPTDPLEIEDCVDILDDLYGSTWRSKAKDLLPASEPKKKPVILCNKAVQTERKINPRKKKLQSSRSNSSEDEFDMFVKNINPNLNSTKKPEIKPKTNGNRCSFIKDTSSDSGSESTYLTAMTNPTVFEKREKTNVPAPVPWTVQRALAICDSETDDEKPHDNRKKLFSDEKSDSSTSEYDPNDDIPVKSKNKFTSVRETKKQTPIGNVKNTKTRNTFLASLSSTIPLDEVHPEARKYRKDFKNTKEELCKHLYKLYNEKIFENKLPSDLSIEWNVRMRGTAGFCYNKRSIKALGSVKRSSRIVLATKILDTPDRLRDTLVHEMCHAAAWLVNEVSDGHGPFWKAWASKAMKAFPELPAIRRCHDYKIMTKFTYRCVGCGYSIGRHSKSLDTEKKRCGHCYGKFELLVNKVTKTGEVEMKTPSRKNPTGFALFVKENYSSVKKEKKGLPHKEVMQLLGQQFSAIKVSKQNDRADN